MCTSDTLEVQEFLYKYKSYFTNTGVSIQVQELLYKYSHYLTNTSVALLVQMSLREKTFKTGLGTVRRNGFSRISAENFCYFTKHTSIRIQRFYFFDSTFTFIATEFDPIVQGIEQKPPKL